MVELHHISDTLQTFDTITLEEMDQVKLMNRTDRKFTFHTDRLPDLLNAVRNDYRVLEVANEKMSRYHSLYFDTPEFKLYHLHHSGKLNRYKFRHREYLENQLGFFEIKFKNNKGRTLKSRVKTPLSVDAWPEKISQFVSGKTPYQLNDMKPAIQINYRRITLVNRNFPERVTIDTSIEFMDSHHEVKPRYLVIAEIKQEKTAASPFLRALQKEHIREGSISKYCMGLALIRNDIKINLFKPALHAISSLI